MMCHSCRKQGVRAGVNYTSYITLKLNELLSEYNGKQLLKSSFQEIAWDFSKPKISYVNLRYTSSLDVYFRCNSR